MIFLDGLASGDNAVLFRCAMPSKNAVNGFRRRLFLPSYVLLSPTGETPSTAKSATLFAW